jgi:hypothetical protein
VHVRVSLYRLVNEYIGHILFIFHVFRIESSHQNKHALSVDVSYTYARPVACTVCERARVCMGVWVQCVVCVCVCVSV